MVEDNQRIEYLHSWEINNIYEEEKTTGYDLIPETERDKLLCLQLANNDMKEFDRIYNEVIYSKVVEMASLMKALNYYELEKK